MVREPLTLQGRIVASRDFPYNGRPFKAGETFPWKRMGLTVRKLRILWQAHLLECVRPKAT
jgi:hypothetical protein